MVCGRDFKVDQYIEVAEVKAGDACPKCEKPVVIDRAIEIGHIFQLGRKYAQALGLTVLDKEGKPQVVTWDLMELVCHVLLRLLRSKLMMRSD